MLTGWGLSETFNRNYGEVFRKLCLNLSKEIKRQEGASFGQLPNKIQMIANQTEVYTAGLIKRYTGSLYSNKTISKGKTIQIPNDAKLDEIYATIKNALDAIKITTDDLSKYILRWSAKLGEIPVECTRTSIYPVAEDARMIMRVAYLNKSILTELQKDINNAKKALK